jgi:hypothetical protein
MAGRAARRGLRRELAMRRTKPAQVLSSLAVMLYVAAPTTIMLTAQETVRIDRLAYSAAGDVTASRHGDLLRPGTSAVYLDAGTYHFRTAGDARVHVTDPDSLTMATSQSIKCIDPPAFMPPPSDTAIPFDNIRGGGMPDHVPALTVTYGDAG